MGWYEAVKDAIGVADQLKNVELKQKLANVQMECANLAEENARVRQENITLREQLDRKSAIHFDAKGCWQAGADGNPVHLCPKCYGEDAKVIPLQERSGDHQCPVCKFWLNPPEIGMPSLDEPSEKSIMNEQF